MVVGRMTVLEQTGLDGGLSVFGIMAGQEWYFNVFHILYHLYLLAFGI